MTELITRVLKYIPKYIIDLVSLLSGPKRFVAIRNSGKTQDLVSALIFGGISLSILYLTQSQSRLMLREEFNWLALINFGVMELITLILMAAVLRFAWYTVGGRGPFVRFFVIYCYFAPITIMISEPFALAAIGYIRLFDIEHYNVLLSIAESRDPFGVEFKEYIRKGIETRSTSFIISIILNILGIIASITWMLIGWGAYRSISNVSRIRSVMALIVSAILGYVVSLLLGLMRAAFLGP